MTPTQSGFTYAWTGPNNYSSSTQDPTIANITSAAAGYYKLIVTNSANGCPSYPDSSNVVVTTALPAPTAGSNSPVCTGTDSIKLTASGTGSTFSWTGPNGFTSGTQNPVISPVVAADSGNYLVTQSNGGSCVSPATTVHVSINAVAVPTGVSASPNPICTGNTLTLTATAPNGGTLTWTFPGGGQATGSPVTRTGVTAAMGGTYSVTQTVNGCTLAAATVLVTVHGTPPAPTFIVSNNPICTGNTLTLTASGAAGATFNWTTPTGTSSSNPLVIPSVTTAAGGNYSVTQTDTGCTSPSSATTDVVVNTTPVIGGATGTSPTTCGGTNGYIVISGLISGDTFAVTYSFNGTAENAGNIIANASGLDTIKNLAAGSYTNIVVTLKGCASAPFSGTITLSPPSTPLAPTVGSNSPVCSGNPLTLNASGQGGAAFSWTGPNGFTSNSATPTISNTARTALNGGSYCATQTVANCTSPQACTTVTVDSTPAITTTGSSNPTTCGGTNGSITLNGLIANTLYNVTYTEGSTVIGPTPITANGTGQVIITGLDSGSYTHIFVTVSGCSSNIIAGPIVLANPSTPSAPTVSSNTPVCSGNVIDLRGTGQTGATFSWTGPLSYASSQDSPTISNATTGMTGNYCATQTVAGCTSSPACTAVTVNQTPAISGSSGTNPTTCGGTDGYIVLSGLTAGQTYSITYSYNDTAKGPVSRLANASGFDTIINLAAGSYTNIVVTLLGCPSAPLNGTISLSNPATPPALNVSSPLVICSGNALNLSATGQTTGATFSWTGPNSFTSKQEDTTVSGSATVGMSGSYCVTQTLAGCTSPQACIAVTVNPTPSASAGPVGGFTSCSGSPVTIGGTPQTGSGGTSPYTYTWNNGAASVSNPSVSPTSTTVYDVTVMDTKLCSATSSTTVTVNSNPIASAGGSFTLPNCSPTGIVIGGAPTASGGTGIGTYTYAWSPTAGLTPSNVANPTVQGISNTTTFTVTVTDGNGCLATAQAVVNVVTNTPSASIAPGGSESWCRGTNTSISLTADVSGGSTPFNYAWSGTDISPTNAQAATVNPNSAGSYNYTVTVTDAFNCTASATSTVTVHATPTVSAGAAGGYKICNGSSVTIGGSPTASGGSQPYSYLWSSGASPVSNPTVNPTIKYYLHCNGYRQ